LVVLADECGPHRSGRFGSSAIHFLTSQDARVRGDTHDDVPMDPIMDGRLAIAMTISVSRQPIAHDGDDGDNKPMWSLELASSRARLHVACGSHALAKSEPLITIVLAMLPPIICPTVARAGCVAETRSNNEDNTRFHHDLPSRVHLPTVATNIFPNLQSDIIEMTTYFASLPSLPRFLTALR
jgi:hypothetical protein